MFNYVLLILPLRFGIWSLDDDDDEITPSIGNHLLTHDIYLSYCGQAKIAD